MCLRAVFSTFVQRPFCSKRLAQGFFSFLQVYLLIREEKTQKVAEKIRGEDETVKNVVLIETMHGQRQKLKVAIMRSATTQSSLRGQKAKKDHTAIRDLYFFFMYISWVEK